MSEKKDSENVVQYKTTSARWSEATGVTPRTIAGAVVPDPIVPEGEGWVLCGNAVLPARIFWFWARCLPVKSEESSAVR